MIEIEEIDNQIFKYSQSCHNVEDVRLNFDLEHKYMSVLENN